MELTDYGSSILYSGWDERMGRNMEMSGDIFTIETGYEEIHIFWNR